MDTLMIARALRELRSISVGLYAGDKISWNLSLLAAIVANTDTSDKPRRHWVASYIDKNVFATFFDLHGLSPISTYFLAVLQMSVRYE